MRALPEGTPNGPQWSCSSSTTPASLFLCTGTGWTPAAPPWSARRFFFYTFDHFQQTNWNDETCNSQSEVYDPNIDFFLMNQDNGGDDALD